MAGEWRVVPRGGPSALTRLRRAYERNREELRFSGWIARVRARGGDVVGAARWLASRWRRGAVLAARAGASSAFAADVKGETAGASFAFRGKLADPFGETLTGVETIRRYQFEAGCVRAGDALAVDRDLIQCQYRIPDGADEVSVDGPAHSARSGLLTFGAVPAGALVAVRYRIRVP
jgi:hypothetical protein